MPKTEHGRRFVADYLKIPELARRLDVSEKTARRYVKAGTLPSTFIGGAYRVTEEDLEEFLHRAEVKPEAAHPKEESRSSLEPPLFNGLEDERRLRYLRGWRVFIHRLARRWEEEPPKTSVEISPLFDSMTALVEQGVFEPSEASASEGHELMLLTVGFQRLNDIADKIEKDEEAEERRATLRLIQDKRSA
jgi:excisionase family DNA binding protein